VDAHEAAAREALEGFMVAFNAQDADALRTTWFHFPHVRFHSGQVSVMERPEDLRILVWERAGQSREWAHSAWDYIETIDAGPEKAHFRVSFSRFREDGTKIGSYRSLYIVTYKDDRWGIQARSSWAA
jgi:hypothetical protein